VNELQIQTVAINYTYHHLGANLLICLGDSMTLESFEQQYKEFPAMAIANLNKTMSSIFQQNVIHVHDGERTNFAESLIKMYYNNSTIQNSQLFDELTAICRKVDQLSQQDFVVLEKDLSVYQKHLSNYGLTDKSILMSNDQHAFKQFWFVCFLIPFSFLGKLIWWIPGKISIWIADKTVTRIDFYTSVLSGIMGVLGFLWWILLVILSYTYLESFTYPIALFSPLWSYVYMQWEERQNDFIALIRLRKMEKNHPDKIMELKKQRSRIMA
jgi:hypothetical protein